MNNRFYREVTACSRGINGQRFTPMVTTGQRRLFSILSGHLSTFQSGSILASVPSSRPSAKKATSEQSDMAFQCGELEEAKRPPACRSRSLCEHSCGELDLNQHGRNAH